VSDTVPIHAHLVLASRFANIELAEQASELLGWGWFCSGYGTVHLWADRGCPVHRELVSLNID